jgi:hypothetical protein
MTNLLFDAPWWLPALLVAVGLALWISGNKRIDAGLKNAGYGFAGLAIALLLVSWFFDSDIERAVKRTHQLVDAVEDQNWQEMRTLLDPKVSFLFYNDRDQIVAGARTAAEEYGVKSIMVTHTEAKQADTVITVTITCIAFLGALQDRPFRSSWQLDWVETGEGWQLMTIHLVPDDARTDEAIKRALPSVR